MLSKPRAFSGLTYEVVPCNEHPDEWRAEAIDYDSEGECYVTIFSGPSSEDRAREYADWMNSRRRPECRT